jgi:CMP-N,N'-diacetyllegionaminic acid synthase
MEKILALIPARGGSKGVPHKNIRPVAGKPLLAYSIEAALAAREMLYRVVVSTDDEQIADTARQLGAEAPFLRPADLASDKSPMVPVVRHAVQFIEQQDSAHLDWVLLLQPTALFRTAEDIRTAVDLAWQGGCDSVISVVQVFSTHPILMKKIEEGRLLPYCIEEKEGTRRQDYQPPAFMRNGAIYLVKRDVVVEKGSMWGDVIHPYVMPEERSVNIDSEMDLRVAEMMLAERKQA